MKLLIKISSCGLAHGPIHIQMNLKIIVWSRKKKNFLAPLRNEYHGVNHSTLLDKLHPYKL